MLIKQLSKPSTSICRLFSRSFLILSICCAIPMTLKPSASSSSSRRKESAVPLPWPERISMWWLASTLSIHFFTKLKTTPDCSSSSSVFDSSSGFAARLRILSIRSSRISISSLLVSPGLILFLTRITAFS